MVDAPPPASQPSNPALYAAPLANLVCDLPRPMGPASLWVQRGFRDIIQIRSGQKAPLLHDWQNVPKRWPAPTLAEFDRLTSGGGASSIGLVTTAFPVFDIDCPHAETAEQLTEVVLRHFPNAPRRWGERPKVAVLLALAASCPPIGKRMLRVFAGPDYGPAPATRATNAAATFKIDILGRAQQLVIQGIHPRTGQPYAWDREDFEIQARFLPVATIEQIDACIAELDELCRARGWQTDRTAAPDLWSDTCLGYRDALAPGQGASPEPIQASAAPGQPAAPATAQSAARRDLDMEPGTSRLVVPVERLMDTIVQGGAGLHEALLQLTMRRVIQGWAPEAVREEAEQLMLRAPRDDEGRWAERFNEIPRLVQGAVQRRAETGMAPRPPREVPGAAGGAPRPAELHDMTMRAPDPVMILMGPLSETVEEMCWQAYHIMAVQKRLPFFRFGGRLCCLAYQWNETNTPAYAQPFSLQLLSSRLGMAMVPVTRQNDQHGNTVTTRKNAWPHSYASGFLAAAASHPMVPALRAFSSVPLFDFATGEITTEPGYSRAHEIWIDHTSNAVKPYLIQNPTRENALAALERLMEPFRQFPFVSARDQSRFVAYLMTCVLRPSLPVVPAPMWVITAVEMGSGKTLLASAGAALVYGSTDVRTVVPPMVGAKSSLDDLDSAAQQEVTKTLVAQIQTGERVLIWDNVKGLLGGVAWETLLTSTTLTARKFGTNDQTLTLPTTGCTYVATLNGHAARLTGDMARRSLMVHLDAGTEQPWRRSGFIRTPMELLQHLVSNRPRFLADIMTIVQAYKVAGCPVENAKPLGTFEAWTRCIVDPLRWLGMEDPVEEDVGAGAETDNADPSRPFVAELLRAIREAYGNQHWSVGWLMEDAFGELLSAQRRFSIPRALVGGPDASAEARERLTARLRDAIAEIKPYLAMDGARVRAEREQLRISLGHLIGRWTKRVVTGHRVTKLRVSDAPHNFYRVELVSSSDGRR